MALRILIADDEYKVRRLVRVLLERAGLDVEVVGDVENGRTALEMVQQEKPDVIITDIRMPGINGLDLIRACKESHPDVAFVIISGYQEFEYAQEAIRYGVEDYLVKPLEQEDLAAVIRKIEKKHRHAQANALAEQKLLQRRREDDVTARKMLMRDFLHQPDSLRGRLDEEMLREKYRCVFSEPAFVFAALKPDTLDAVEHPRLYPFLQEKLEQTLKRCLKEVGLAHLTICEQQTAWILFNSRLSRISEIQKILQRMIYMLRMECSAVPGLHVTGVLGKPVSALAELPESLDSTRFTLQDRLVQGTDHLLSGKIPYSSYDVSDFLTVALRRRLIETVESLKTGESVEMIQKLGAQVQAVPGCTGAFVLQIAGALLELLVFSIKNAFSAEEASAFEKSLRQRLPMCASAGEVFAQFETILQSTRESLLQKQTERDCQPVQQAKQYIQKHYAQEITLSEVGREVGLTPAYLSTLFKKETGQSFLDFVTETRIQAAGNLLLNTQETLETITEAVGYSDVKYFCRTFKKKMGLSPTEYRKLYY